MVNFTRTSLVASSRYPAALIMVSIFAHQSFLGLDQCLRSGIYSWPTRAPRRQAPERARAALPPRRGRLTVLVPFWWSGGEKCSAATLIRTSSPDRHQIGVHGGARRQPDRPGRARPAAEDAPFWFPFGGVVPKNAALRHVSAPVRRTRTRSWPEGRGPSRTGQVDDVSDASPVHHQQRVVEQLHGLSSTERRDGRHDRVD